MLKSYFDRIDENDTLTGGKASYDEVHSQGLWHRGVHIILYTPQGEIVMQKRSPSLKYHPAEIEISVGGGVDAGESPDEAIVREVYEELGLRLKKPDVHFIGKTKSNHRTKTQINRVFIYSYSACIPKEAINTNTQNEETSTVFWITKRKLRSALRRHRIKNFGRISDVNAYWNYLLNAI